MAKGAKVQYSALRMASTRSGVGRGRMASSGLKWGGEGGGGGVRVMHWEGVEWSGVGWAWWVGLQVMLHTQTDTQAGVACLDQTQH